LGGVTRLAVEVLGGVVGAGAAIGAGGVEGRAHRASKLRKPSRVMATLPLSISSVH
jgi:hypothetical protein